MIGVVGSVGGLVYKDYRDDQRDAAFDEKTALVALDEAIINWDLGSPSAMEEYVAEHWPDWLTFQEETNATPENRRTWDEDWGFKKESVRGDLFAANTSFGEVRRAYNEAVRQTDGDKREWVGDYFRAATIRLYGLIRVVNTFPGSSWTELSSEEQEMLNAFAKEGVIVGRYARVDNKGEEFDKCPTTFVVDDQGVTVQQTSDCLETGHYWFAENVLNRLNSE